MVTLPPGFDVSALYSDFSVVVVPFVGIALAYAAYIVVAKLFKRF